MNILHNDDGLAMTEGVIVIPFFIAVWLGVFSLYCYYTARLDAQSDATGTAYAGAMGGDCNDQSLNNVEGAPVVDDATISMDGGKWEQLGEHIPLVPSRVAPKVKVSHEVYGREREAEGSRLMQCNSKPIDGFFEMIFDMAEGWLENGSKEKKD